MNLLVRTLRLVLGLTLLTVPAFAELEEASPDQLEADANVVIGEHTVVTPSSTQGTASDFGVRARTRYRISVLRARRKLPQGENPFTLRRIYGVPPIGGRGTIAIVSAFHYATALGDFNTFSRMFGLPRERSADAFAATNRVFQVIHARGTQPADNASWALESAMDIEWAHAMAPQAKIVLVQASSSNFGDLFQAVQVASNLPGVEQVSMSWGGPEFSLQTTLEPILDKPGVLFFAASGDVAGQASYPATSPRVIACGGTRVNRTARGAFISETGWASGGGGPSAFFSTPSYQASNEKVAAIVNGARGTPDLSFNADPDTGVAVYTSTPYLGESGWLVLGGTSVSAPALAGIVNNAHSWTRTDPANTAAELELIYKNAGKRFAFRDILAGTSGSFSCAPGWDFVTGVGSCSSILGK